MMRNLTVLALLGLALGAGIAVRYVGSALEQEQTVLEWSNALVAKTLHASYAPEFSALKLRRGPQPNHWVVAGRVTVPHAEGAGEQRPFEAVVRKVCASRTSERCWRLERLTIEDQAVVNAPGNAMAPMKTALVPSTAREESPGPVGVDSGRASTEGSPRTPLAKIDIAAPDMLPEERTPPSDGQLAEESDIGEPGEDIREPEENVTAAAENGEAAAEEPAVVPTNPPAKPARAEADLDGETGPPDNLNGRNGAPHDLVVQIQRALNRLGFGGSRPLQLDGKVGPRTREAIRVYQQASGLDPTGRPSQDLLAHLETNTPASETNTHARPERGLKLQLGAFRVADNARRAWRTLQSRHHDLLGDLDHWTEPTGGLHLLLVGPLPDAATAAARCAALQERGADCLVVRR